MNLDEFLELSAGHALHALSPSDERAFLDALDAHPEWAAIASADAATAASLADVPAELAPPRDLRARLLAQIADPTEAEASAAPDTPAAAAEDIAAAAVSRDDAPADENDAPPPSTEPAPSTEMMQTVQRRNWTRAIFGLAASMVLLVGLGWGVGALSNLWQTPADVQALHRIEEAPDAQSASADLSDGTVATLHWSESVGSVVIVMDDLAALPADQTYELWFVRGDAPVSAGTFEASGARTTTELTGAMQPGDVVAVTVEPAGGSPSGAPTSDPIVAIPTTT